MPLLPRRAGKRTRISKMKLSELTALFAGAGIDEADTEAKILFSHIEKIAYGSLFGRDPESRSPLLSEAAARRIGGEPLAYIIGEAPFFRQSYFVNRDCLIPRFDTERFGACGNSGGGASLTEGRTFYRSLYRLRGDRYLGSLREGRYHRRRC